MLYAVWMIMFLMLSVQVLTAQAGAFHSGDTLFIAHGTTPTVNGVLSAGEWDDALSIVLLEPGGAPGDATLYLKHDTSNLYAAFENTNVNHWIWWILLDTQNNGGGAPQTDDYKLIGPGFMVEHVGNGAEWVEVTANGWTSAGNEFSSECSISYGKLGITPGVAKTLGVAFCYGGGMPWENVWPPNFDTWNDEVVPNTWGDLVSSDDWGTAGISEEATGQRDLHLRLGPNPFSDQVKISFVLDTPCFATLQIYDTGGRMIATLVDGRLEAGKYAFAWNCLDHGAKVVPSGIYFARLQTGNRVVSTPVTVIQ